MTLNGVSALYVILDLQQLWYSEFNYINNGAGQCILISGATPLSNNDSCSDGSDYWYERTAYRKIPYSSCEDGQRPDRGPQHLCFKAGPGIRAHGALFWFFVTCFPLAFTVLVAYCYYRRMGLARGWVPGVLSMSNWGWQKFEAPSNYQMTRDQLMIAPRASCQRSLPYQGSLQD